MKPLVVLTVLTLSAVAGLGYGLQAAPYTQAVLGEARGEGLRGMYAVAHGIRNRGSLRGVYGAKATTEPLGLELRATAFLAWFLSLLGPDVTHGSDHWENIYAFGTPTWARGREPRATIGRHTFWRIQR